MPRTSRLSTVYHFKVVNSVLLGLLCIFILVSYRVLANYNIKLGPLAIINGLIPFLWNIFTTHQVVRGQPGCDWAVPSNLGLSFWFLVCYASTQLATALLQRRIFSFFLSFFICEDPIRSPDEVDGERPINHLGPKRLYRTGGEGVFLLLEQTLGDSTI